MRRFFTIHGRDRRHGRRHGEHGGISPVVGIVGVAVVAFVIALVTMGLGGSDSPRDVAAVGQTAPTVAPGPCGDGKPDPTYTVALTSDPTPPRPEGTTFHLAVRHNGEAVTGARVCMNADMPGMLHAGVNKEATETSAGVYDARLGFSMGGGWAASITVLEPGRAPVVVPVVFEVGQ